MKSRASFFNFTVLWKDLTRFWPLWGIILAIRLMTLATGITAITPYAYTITNMTLAAGQGFFGWLCAVLLFGDLFKARAAGTLHALPIRREGWFLTHSVAGILMYVLAIGIPRVATMLTLQEFWYLEALTLAIEFGMFLFFFGLAAFCIQCAGTWFGSAAVYVVINLLPYLLLYLAQTFYEPQFYGIRIEAGFLQYLCPLVSLSTRQFFILEYKALSYSSSYQLDDCRNVTFKGLVSGDWWYLLAVVLAGLVIFALALLLYRRRHVESAGSFIVLRPVGIGFLVLTTLLVGAVWFIIGGESYILLAFGLLLGFFPVLMLLEKRLKVFRKKTLLAFGVLALAVFGSIFLARLDPLGVDTFVPKPEQVKSATVETGYYSDPFFSYTNSDAVTLDTPEELAMLETLHKTFLEEKGTVDEEGSYTELFITYQLRSGRKLYRVYPIAPKGDSKQQSKQLLSRLDTFQDTGFLRNVLNIEYQRHSDWVDSKTVPEVLIQAMPLNPGYVNSGFDIRHKSETTLDQDPMALGLWEALWKDCETGAMAQNWDFHASSFGYLSITYLDENGNKRSESYTIYADCANLREYLLSLKTN